MTIHTTNPLLDFTDLPQFSRIQPEHITPAVQVLLQKANAALERVVTADFPSQWTAISRELDVACEQLGTAWGAVSHLNSVLDTPALRAAYNEALPLVTAFWTQLGSDTRLYEKYKAIDPAALNAEQQQAHRNAVRNFVLSGAELPTDAKNRFAAIQDRMAALTQKFGENTLDCTDAFAYYADEKELTGVPDDIKQSTREVAQAEAKSGHKLTLKIPCYLPIMQFAASSALRGRLYRAYVTRASDQATEDFLKYDNSALIQEILLLRQEEASLLGYPNFGTLSLFPKMAQSPEQVIQFLRDLAKKARPFAEKDLADMRTFAKSELTLNDPQAWDWAYIGEKLKESRYAFSEHEVKQYFPAPQVLAGLFKIVESLFEVQILADNASVWNDKVAFYRIERMGQLVGQFYLDATSRTGKRGGAWMDDVRARWLRPDNGVLQTPVAHLVCNFPDGVAGKPPLLTHDDVTTLFHEFGHGLHHLLTRVNERDVSGISGVEWDAVELPSQFMENFCWEWNVLKHMTAHVDTGAPLPRALFDKMHAAKNYQAGLQTLRQVEFSMVDMLLHTTHPPKDDIQSLVENVRQEIAIMQTPKFNRSMHTFSHIFAGGYAAGYYSYKWAEVLSADAYAAFEETAPEDGTLNLAMGNRYRETILEVGGSRPAMDSFKAFRGRAPSIEALLRHQGMTALQ